MSSYGSHTCPGVGRAVGAVALICAVLGASTARSAEPLTLTLDEAVELALERNREIEIAEAGAEAARARLGQARSAFFPSISASGSYTKLDEAPSMDTSQFGNLFEPLMDPFLYLVEQGYLDPSTLEGLQSTGGDGKIYLGDDDIYSIGLNVRQPLFTGGRILSAHGAAKHAARAQEHRAARTTDRVRYEAASAYLGLLRAQAALEVMNDAVEEMESHLSDLRAMHEAGVLLEAELMRGRVRMSEVELSRNTARHRVDLAEASLAFVLGRPPGQEIVTADLLESHAFPERGLDAWTELALKERADLLAAEEMVAAADNGVTRARSGYFPSLVAMGSYMWDRPNREYEPEFYEHWSVTLALEMNIFDWGLTGNRVREARAGLTQAERGRDMTRDAVRLEVRQAFLEREEALEGLAIAESSVELAEESLRVTRERFKSKQVTNSDVLSAQTALTRARMNRLDALARLRLAESGLVLATSVTVAEGDTR
ncbi:MAG: hypothetical protein GF400_00760 [Candidatus Eisenbacteria bacterium]|nr:hypothetical protein [Candidatus Eisenbacteria bacterium]